jgi:hypothetical protein
VPLNETAPAVACGKGQQRCDERLAQLTEWEVPWPEDGAIHNSPQGQEHSDERDAHQPVATAHDR